MGIEVTEFRFDRPCVQCNGVVRYINEPKQCVACVYAYRRLPRVKERRNGGLKVGDNSPTLDRKDSTRGYVPDNVWVISHRANRMKNNATLEEMELLVKNWQLQSLR